MGCPPPAENETPNKKSFQICVNCQITVTTMIGNDNGSIILVKMVRNPAPSIVAALTNSLGTVIKKLRKNNVVKPMPYTMCTSTSPPTEPDKPKL